jgi:O-antigen ligase
VDGWRVALAQVEDYPLAGSGGGSYERHWLADRPYEFAIRDAHNLYLESLAEYGPLGLVLVVALFAVPLGMGLRLRHVPLVPAAVGVLVLYVVHATVDWDWEFPVLTLSALAGAAAVMASGSPRTVAGAFERRRILLLAIVLALVPIAALGALGARAEAASADAAAEKDYDRAVAEARRAERLEPWSVEPLLLLGRAQALGGDRVAARSTFRRALRREPQSWRLWYELAAVSTGTERRVALREARALNPLEDLLDALEQG